MLAATNVRFRLRVALRAACLAATIASATVATAQDIILTNGTTANVPVDFAPGTYGSVGITGTSTLEVDAPLAVTTELYVDASSTLTVNADIVMGSNVFAYVNGSTLSLDSGTFGGAGSGIALSNSVFQRTNGRYAVDVFQVSSGSAHFVAGDSIARSLQVLDSTFTLSSNLTLTGTNVVLTDGVYLSGSTTSLARTLGATVTSQVLTVDGYAVFSSQTGDDFTDAGVVAGYGGSIFMTGSQSLRSIDVVGSGAAVGSFTASAPITVGDGDPGTDDIRVRDGGLFVADADVTAGSVFVDIGGGFRLASGTATATTLVVNSGSLSRLAGASYQIDTIVLDNTAMDFEANDSVGSLTLTDLSLFVTGTSLAALELQHLTIDSSQLILGSFDGVDSAVSGWGLKVANDVETILLGHIASSRIVSLSSEPLSVLYDSDTNATYITAVPEPSTLALAAAGGLLAGWRTLRRRRTAA